MTPKLLIGHIQIVLAIIVRGVRAAPPWAAKERGLAFAPTRGRKGAGLVVPILLGRAGPAVARAIEGEDRQLATDRRSIFSHSVPVPPEKAR
jgi:type IV secretory pathway TraG/TraD family ATPase VirD4